MHAPVCDVFLCLFLSYMGACIFEGQLHPLTEVSMSASFPVHTLPFTLSSLLPSLLPVREWRCSGAVDPKPLARLPLAQQNPPLPGHRKGHALPPHKQHAPQRPQLKKRPPAQARVKVHRSRGGLWTGSEKDPPLSVSKLVQFREGG